MCICCVAINQNENFPFIIFHNRDESLDRKTTDPFIDEKTKVLSAIDLEAFGTWMGFSIETGNFAMLTNCWSESIFKDIKEPISRGKLVQHFLLKGKDESIFEERGFNIIYGNLLKDKELIYASNRTSTIPQDIQKPKQVKIQDGVHVLSNSFLNDSTWPKVKLLHEKSKTLLSDLPNDIKPEDLRDKIFDIMTTRPQCKELPDSKTIQSTHYSDADKEELGNIFVNAMDKRYKTKSIVVILVHKSGKIFYYHKNTENLKVDGKDVEKSNDIKEFIIDSKESQSL